MKAAQRLRATPRLKDSRAATARLRAAQADLAELAVKARRAKLIPAEDVRRVCEKALELFDVGDELAGCADDIAKMAEPAMIRARLFAEARRIRRRVSERFAKLAISEAEKR